MELSTYLNTKVQIILSNGFTYIGLVIDVDENSITIIDKTNSKVCIKEVSINFIKEIENGSY